MNYINYNANFISYRSYKTYIAARIRNGPKMRESHKY